MTSHSVALMMLGMAIGGSLATTVLCLCASARCRDCRFRYGPEWPEDDLPAGGQSPSTAPANSPARIGSHASAEDPASREQTNDAQAGDGSCRESRAGLGGFASILSEFWQRRDAMRRSSPWRPCACCGVLGTDSSLDGATGMCKSCWEKRRVS